MHKDTVEDKHTDLDYELLLRGCNGKLTQWMDHWHSELKKGMCVYVCVIVLAQRANVPQQMDSPSTSRSFRSSVSTSGYSSTRYLFNLHSMTRLVRPSGPHLNARFDSEPQYRSTSLQGLTNSYKSALQTLQIITQEFAPWGMLVCLSHAQF